MAIERATKHVLMCRLHQRFNNPLRLHSTIGDISPVEFEKRAELA
jgi:hypothetical protein